MAGNSVRFTATIDDKVSAKLGVIGQKFDKTFGKNSAAVMFGALGAKAIAAGFSLIGDAISGTTGFLVDSVKAFNDDAQSQALFHNALENNIEGWKFSQAAVDDYVDAQIERGFIDDDVRASLSQLVGITHDATKAQELNTLAQDLARAKGLDLGQATDIVTKAAQGNSKALRPLGIAVGKTADAAAILDAIQRNVKGSADAWADTTAGKLQIAQDKFAEAQEKLGGMIMPVLTAVLEKLVNDWLPALGRGWDKVMDVMRPVIGVISTIIGKIGDLIQAVKNALKWLDNLKGQSEFYHPQAPNIPGHAQGGMVGLNGPEMIMVGERGPEQVIANRSSGGGGGGVPVTIPVILDGREIGRIMDERLYYTIRRAPPAGNSV